MACKACEERRQIVVSTYRKEGPVAVVVKAVPKVVKHMFRTPLIQRKK